jgi:protein-tyrosine-phosphatase
VKPDSKTILFVCTANVCRSPMAEYLLRARLGPETEWTVGSAGLAAWGGSPASREAVSVMAEKGLDLGPHRSRPLTSDLVRGAGLIVVMTGAHQEDILRLYPEAKGRVYRLKSFGLAGRQANIDDPVGLSTEGYRVVRDEIDRAISDLVLYLLDRGKAPGGLRSANGS